MGLFGAVRAYASRSASQNVHALGGLHLGSLTSRIVLPSSLLAANASFLRQVQCTSADSSDRPTPGSRNVLKQAAAPANLEQADRCSRQPTAPAAGSHLREPGGSDAICVSSHDSLSTADNTARVSRMAVSINSRVQSRDSQCLSEAASEAPPACTAATDSIGPASRRRRLPQRAATDSIESASRSRRLPHNQRVARTQLHSVLEPLAPASQDAIFSHSSGSSNSSTGSGSSSATIAPACCDSTTTTHHGTLCSALPQPMMQDLSFHDSTFTPRDFQVEAIQCIVQAWAAGSSVQLVMLPTGTGKTVVFVLLSRFVAQYYNTVVPVTTLNAACSPREPDNGSSNSKHANLGVAVAQGVCAQELSLKELDAACVHRSTIHSAADHSHGVSCSTHHEASAKAAALRQLLPSAAPRSDPAGGTGIQPGGVYSGATSRGRNSSHSRRSSKRSARVCLSQATDHTAGSAGGIGDATVSMPAQPYAVNSRQGGEPMRVLVLAHRGELLQQAQEKYQLIWPEATVSWVKGARKEFWGQVVLASVLTAVNCVEQLAACRFSLVVVDEAHHSVSSSSIQVLKGLGFVEVVAADTATLGDQDGNDSADSSSSNSADSVSSCDEDATWGSSSDSSNSSGTSPGAFAKRLQALYSPHTLLVGFTATPYRLRKEDSEQLYEVFEQTYTQSIRDMIKRKCLSQIHCRKILTNTDLKGARAVNGDFTAATLSPIVNSSSRNKLVLQAYFDYCTAPATSSAGSHETSSQLVQQLSHSGSSTSSTDVGGTITTNGNEFRDAHVQATTMSGRHVTRKAIGFAVDICHAETLNALFLDAGIRSGVIHSKRPDDENARILKELKYGQLDIVWNVEKLTEGFDEPSLDAVLMVRPTRSKGLYTQMLGRGLRRYPGKENCLVLDFADKYHRADCTMDLRVLLGDDGPYTNLDPLPPPSVDRVAKVDSKGLKGGEMSVLGDDIDPLDMAWKQFGSHWMCNLFDIGNVWLVNVAEMGSNQRQMLGLQLQGYKDHGKAAAVEVVTAGIAASTAGHSPSNKQLINRQFGLEALGDRYVVLHQRNSKDDSPMTWSNGAPSAVQGMTALDAYGAALDYMELLVRKQQQKAIWSWKKDHRSAKPPAQLTTFKRDAPWRRDAMSPKQADLLQKLQEKLGPDEYNQLPVPLLATFAATMGASDDA